MAAATDTAARALLSWRNPDGGWGYGPERTSRLEPTCLALLALAGRLPAGEAGRVLGAMAMRSGVFADGDLPPNYAANGLALVILLGAGGGLPPRARELAFALAGVKGLTFDRSPDVAHDTRLAAWPWVSGSFSWVEPTAWCVLGLKRYRQSDPAGGADAPSPATLADRLDEAERLLLDRAIDGSGWNYGNTRVFGTRLPAYVPTTALALLALQDRPTEPATVGGVDWLADESLGEPSSLALGLAAVALHVLAGAEAADFLDGPIADRVPVAIDLRQLPGVAWALYALDRHRHDCAHLRV